MSGRGLIAGIVLLTLAAAVLSGHGGRPAGASTEAAISIRYSAFAPRSVTVTAGEPVTFTLRSEDPIEHEWILGTEEVHERHRTGSEPYHEAMPTEVTLPAYSTRVTTVTFEGAGEYVFICHLPGHEAYGMKGTVRVVARQGS